MCSGHHPVKPYRGEGPGSQVVQPHMGKLRHREGKGTVQGHRVHGWAEYCAQALPCPTYLC